MVRARRQFDGDADVTAVLERLRREGLLEPLHAADGSQRRLWTACDLANMVEGAFDERLDPTALDDETRAAWLARLEGSYHTPDVTKDHILGPRFWLLDGAGQRAGTVQVPVDLLGRRLVSVYALYVLPAARRQGIATRLLDRLYELACVAGHDGIRIDTHWTWQRSIRFYLARGLWVFWWKHDVSFMRDRLLPVRRIDVAAGQARFAIAEAREWTDLWHARPDGDRLVLEETPAVAAMDEERRFDVGIHGLATLSLALAVEGWPLVRSAEAWAERYRSMDVGQPEGLAYKIEIFEATARGNRWVVRTPRIPGLSYCV